MRKRLVLDAGGVLYTETFRAFLGELAVSAGHSAEEGVGYYNEQLRPYLWRGGIEVDAFWASYADAFAIPRPELQGKLNDGAPPIFGELPAVKRLSDWAERAELWVLSNHRSEWLLPELERSGVKQLFERIIVSSDVQLMKPDREIYAPLREGSPEQVIFVDDKPENLAVALEAGAVDVAIRADKAGSWIALVDALLGVSAQ